MDFISRNWQLIFGGLGTAVVAAIVGAWAKAYFEKPKSTPKKDTKPITQTIKSGNNSTNYQAGGDIDVSGKQN